MIIDGRTLRSDLSADVCVVGSGIAGMTVVEQLVEHGLTVVVVERGGAPGDRPRLDFESPHFESPADTLQFGLGGMVSTWNSRLPDGTAGARYLPLEPVDLAERWWVPHSGWPLDAADLAPYVARARRRCGVATLDFDGTSSLDPTRPPLAPPSGHVVTRLDQMGPAAVFDPASMATVGGDRLTVVTGRVVTRLEPDGRAVSTTIRGRGVDDVAVRSRAVVVAAGAIESARLLLASTDWGGALGNEYDHVGRYFMDHPRIQLGHGALAAGAASRLGLYETHEVDGYAYVGKLTLSETTLRREGLLNGNALLAPHHLSARELSAVRSGRQLADAVRRRRRRPPDLAWHVRRVLAGGGPAVVRQGLARARRSDDLATAGVERWTGVVARSFRLNYQAEQVPNRWNRVTLTDRRDDLGLAVPALRWRWSPQDLASIERVRQLMAADLAACGVGAMAPQADALPVGELGGRPRSAHHHLGTVRMSRHPRDGVVDRDGRVHGVPNVFVAGGAVFPTGGHANPTLTIVALALRLADALRTSLRP